MLLLLRDESRQQNQVAETDWLTGLYNQNTMAQKINELLAAKQRGVLFLIDADNFKAINDRYGHMAGDDVLKGIADMLGRITLRHDLLGRIGEDEFAIFMPISQEPDFIDSRCRQIEEQFRDLSSSQLVVSRLSVAVSGSAYQPGDDYQRLFERAEQALRAKKEERRAKASAAIDRPLEASKRSGLKMDIKQIRRELSEPGIIEGAYCQDYESFLSIYRFMERRLKRIKSSIFSVLITLYDSQGGFPPLEERNTPMEDLHQIIQHSLRAGDVFTRYSSCQFLIMVSDVTASQADAVAERIQASFTQYASEDGKYQLVYDRYPLKPAATPEVPGKDNN